jgi:peptidoglycan/xylan/chitin deacetylase (PgdA/CDA1 family)
MKYSLAGASSLAVPQVQAATALSPSAISTGPKDDGASFWPDGARLCISLSMQFEAGGQPLSGASGLIPEPIAQGYPDLATNSFFEYGVNEGIPRMLDLFDKHSIKVTSFMVGQAVDQHPELAREIAKRGHECAAHGKR